MRKIFAYSNYREYLKDKCDHLKFQDPSFSFRYLAKKAGINSSSFFPTIISGSRNLTKATILKTCVALDLEHDEAEYFENLVKFNQAKSISEKNKLFENLIEKQNRKNADVIPTSNYDYFKEWYHCVVRELAVMKNFKGDFKQLGKMLEPAITEKQARESVELLLKLGYLSKKGTKYYHQEPSLTSGPDIKAHQVIQFQVKMLQRSIEAFKIFRPEDPLSHSSTTLSLSLETYEKIKKLNRAHRAELMKLSEGDSNPDHVFQLNMNLFPVSKIARRNRG